MIVEQMDTTLRERFKKASNFVLSDPKKVHEEFSDANKCQKYLCPEFTLTVSQFKLELSDFSDNLKSAP